MTRILPAFLVLVASACHVEQSPAANEVEAPSAPVAPEPAQPPAPPPLAANPPPPHLDPDAPPLPSEKSALGAARRLQEYCDAVATGRFGDAYRYWSDDGRASGLSLAQFRETFSKYAAYDCHIGTPGNTEGAAGSIYVEIPLRVTGALAQGGGFVLEGLVTMRRVNDVDGSTAEQRRWHIASSGLKPRP